MTLLRGGSPGFDATTGSGLQEEPSVTVFFNSVRSRRAKLMRPYLCHMVPMLSKRIRGRKENDVAMKSYAIAGKRMVVNTVFNMETTQDRQDVIYRDFLALHRLPKIFPSALCEFHATSKE